jgi:hypothetical protein
VNRRRAPGGGSAAGWAGIHAIVFALSVGVAGALVAITAAAQGKWQQWDGDFDDEKKPWKEIEAKMPAFPVTKDLLPFDVGPASPHRFFIDARSLSIGEDGVVRYTLVVRAGGGATNTTFEGMRCELREQKYYAVGQPDGNWTRARNAKWRRIEQRDLNNHHIVLHAEFLCPGKMTPGSVREVLQALKYGPPIR